jgi:hypothetical protein
VPCGRESACEKPVVSGNKKQKNKHTKDTPQSSVPHLKENVLHLHLELRGGGHDVVEDSHACERVVIS